MCISLCLLDWRSHTVFFNCSPPYGLKQGLTGLSTLATASVQHPYHSICTTASIPQHPYHSISTIASVPQHQYHNIRTTTYVPQHQYHNICTTTSVPHQYHSIRTTASIPQHPYHNISTTASGPQHLYHNIRTTASVSQHQYHSIRTIPSVSHHQYHSICTEASVQVACSSIGPELHNPKATLSHMWLLTFMLKNINTNLKISKSLIWLGIRLIVTYFKGPWINNLDPMERHYWGREQVTKSEY